MRVYELAEELNLDDKTVLGLAADIAPLGTRETDYGSPWGGRGGDIVAWTIKNRMSALTAAQESAIRRAASKRLEVTKVVERVGATVVKRKRPTFSGVPTVVVEPDAVDRILYEHARGSCVPPWDRFVIRVGAWDALCVRESGGIRFVGSRNPEGVELPAIDYPGIDTPRGRELAARDLSRAFEAIVRAVVSLGSDDSEHRESDVRILLPASKEMPRVVYVYLSLDWVQKQASHCILIRKGAMPHMRRGHHRKQRCGEGRADSKDVWVRPASVKQGQSWAEYRIASRKPQKDKTRTT